MLVAFDLHGDLNDRVVVPAVPKLVFLRDSEGEGHVLLALLNAGELVGPHFGTATEDGDVEVLAVVVAGTVVVAVGPVTAHVNFEIATEFTVFFHEECLLEIGFHAEAQVDVDEAVVFFFSEFTLRRGFFVAGVEVRPGVGEPIVEEVHRGVVGVGLTRVFLLFLLGCNIAALDGDEQHGDEEQRNHGGATHGKSTRGLAFEGFFNGCGRLNRSSDGNPRCWGGRPAADV